MDQNYTPVFPDQLAISLDAHPALSDNVGLPEGQVRSLLEIMPTAVFSCDREGLITYYNQRAAELWGREPRLGHPQDRYCGSYRIYRRDGTRLPHHECPMAIAVLTGRGTRNEEIEIERPDGSMIIASVNVDPLYAPTGERIGAINVFEDITARKQAEMEREQLLRSLAQEQEKLQQFTTTLEERVLLRTLEVRKLAAQLSLAEHKERDRIAHILHDHVQQLLYAVQCKIYLTKLDATSAQPHLLGTYLEEMRSLTDEAIQALRTLTVELSPPVLENEGLLEALEWLSNQMRTLYSLQVEITFCGDCHIADSNVRVVVFQAVRELLFNVVKHAQVSQASISVSQKANHLMVTVHDNGKGMASRPSANSHNHNGGFGLSSIQDRLELFDGKLEIKSRPGQGTQVEVILPLHANFITV